MDTIEFKSDIEYYYAEEQDSKNHTERFIELDDERAKLLEEYCKADFDMELRIKICLAQELKTSFNREVRHACKFAGMWIITWHPLPSHL